MSNQININITEESVSKFLEEAIKKEIDKRLSSSYIIDNSIRLVISDNLKESDIKSKIDKVIQQVLEDDQSIVHKVIERNTEKWFERNTHTLSTIMGNCVGKLLKSKEVFDAYVEPVVSKAIVQDPSFIPYLKNEVSIRLNEKIKNISKSIGDTISTSVVKEFLKQYMTNRFEDADSQK